MTKLFHSKAYNIGYSGTNHDAWLAAERALAAGRDDTLECLFHGATVEAADRYGGRLIMLYKAMMPRILAMPEERRARLVLKITQQLTPGRYVIKKPDAWERLFDENKLTALVSSMRYQFPQETRTDGLYAIFSALCRIGAPDYFYKTFIQAGGLDINADSSHALYLPRPALLLAHGAAFDKHGYTVLKMLHADHGLDITALTKKCRDLILAAPRESGDLPFLRKMYANLNIAHKEFTGKTYEEQRNPRLSPAAP